MEYLSRYIACSLCQDKKAEWTVRNENTNALLHLCEECSKRYRESWKYVSSIRNSAKRLFAEQYRMYLLSERSEPHRPVGLGVMAEQAVRMRLDTIFSDEEGK